MRTHEHNTKAFSWNNNESTFAACASTLGYVAGAPVPASMVLVSHMSGDKKTVRCTHIERDAENEIQWWEYEPFDSIFKVVVFND